MAGPLLVGKYPHHGGFDPALRGIGRHKEFLVVLNIESENIRRVLDGSVAMIFLLSSFR
jgi:hypothetical protein